MLRVVDIKLLSLCLPVPEILSALGGKRGGTNGAEQS